MESNQILFSQFGLQEKKLADPEMINSKIINKVYKYFSLRS